MRKSDFHFDLPGELIAQMPASERAASRLLCLDGSSGEIVDRQFRDLPQLLNPGDLLVFNDTRVIPARLFGRKETGGQVEILVERILSATRVRAQVRASKSPKPGSMLVLDGGFGCEVVGREGEWFLLDFAASATNVLAVLDAIGHIPLPPYIERADAEADRERYQTVFARRPGAVAAPTAGLHFDESTLQRLAERGIASTTVTLHVGAGTFQPMRAESLDDHVMHAEYCEVGPEVVADAETARAAGGRVVAVGTTAVRALESASVDGRLAPFAGDTRLFIRPGYRFRSVDAMLTNFHLPESTLLCLVCAFAGYEPVMNAYRHAVAQRYRFFSYGDAMFLTRGSE